MIRRAIVGLLLALPSVARAQSIEQLDPHARAVAEGSKIRLEWSSNADASSWIVRRREGTSGAWVTLAASLSGATTSYDDASVEKGKLYEYNVQKKGSTSGNSYVLAGIEVPFVDDGGVVALVVDGESAAKVAAKLDRLRDDLRAEGVWVERVDVARNDEPKVVRAKLIELRAKHGARFKAALLLGGVPRVFSGLVNPDAHPDHRGAWPADGYYGDLDGTWTDAQQLGGEGKFVNKAGDGKLDPSKLPSDLEIAIGRVDTLGLPAFAPLGAEDLLARWLDANHAFRTGQKTIAERTWVSDSFGYFSGEAFARIAFRDGTAIFGKEPEKGKPFFDALEDGAGYLLAFGCGAGSPTSAAGVGTTADFVKRKPNTVFLGLFGSYFGDWAYDDNLMRAALVGPGTVQATIWFSRPNHHVHHLGALRTFGEAFVATANNSGTSYDVGSFARSVHLALLGDPTLRLFVSRPPSSLVAKGEPGRVSLSWTASPDASLGHHVYRRVAGKPDAETRLTTEPSKATTFADETASPGESYEYRVVGVRLRTTGSGTFFEHSPGAMAQATALEGGGDAGTSDDAGADAGASGAPASDEATSGCSCRTNASAPSGPALLAIAIASLLGRRRRSTVDRRPAE